MQDTIDRQRQQIMYLRRAATFASKELRAWFGNFNADAMHRMREDLVRVADTLDAALTAAAPSDRSRGGET